MRDISANLGIPGSHSGTMECGPEIGPTPCTASSRVAKEKCNLNREVAGPTMLKPPMALESEVRYMINGGQVRLNPENAGPSTTFGTLCAPNSAQDDSMIGRTTALLTNCSIVGRACGSRH